MLTAPPALPVHPLTGAQAVGWRKPRTGEDQADLYPIWPVLGGAGDGGDGGTDNSGAGDDDGGTDDQDTGDGSDDNADGEDDALGDKGRRALRELRRENRQLKAQIRQNGTGAAAKTTAAKKDGDAADSGDVDADAIREQAREEARAEVWTERVEAAAIAAAAGRLANPARVAQLLREDLADVPKDDKGRPDREAIGELIDDLLKSDPYLAVPATGGGRRFQGDADSGARKTTKKAAASLGEAVAARLAGKTTG